MDHIEVASSVHKDDTSGFPNLAVTASSLMPDALLMIEIMARTSPNAFRSEERRVGKECW